MTATATTAANERRRAARRQPAQGTTCHLATGAGQDAGTGLVWNISLTGVSMLVGHPVELGAQLQGELTSADGQSSVGLAMRVAHLKPLATGDYFLGGQFQRHLTVQELRPFIGDFGAEH